MKVILLKDVKGVGRKFEEKNVSDGYAANFLLPGNLALVADKSGLARVEQLKKQTDVKKTKEQEELEAKAKKREAKRLELEKFRQFEDLKRSSKQK